MREDTICALRDNQGVRIMKSGSSKKLAQYAKLSDHDVKALCRHFGIPIPQDYAEFVKNDPAP
jgi:hypothetical protein